MNDEYADTFTNFKMLCQKLTPSATKLQGTESYISGIKKTRKDLSNFILLDPNELYALISSFSLARDLNIPESTSQLYKKLLQAELQRRGFS